MTRRSEWPEPPPEGAGGPAPDARTRPGGRRAVGGRPAHGPPAGGPPADPVERARSVCLTLLTGTPRTRRQLADALRRREIPEEAIAEVLDCFEEVGLIDDAVFAEAWVESRHHGRGLARRALARELRTRGVASSVIEEAVSRLEPEDEEETARALVARRLPATRGLPTPKRMRRLVGMLARKGYPEGLALRVVREALEREGQAVDEDAWDVPE
ncbi:recombination regulator RecX [Streptomyces triticirhizae]|uniref:Regulatory protein RecX n=1 Tax=Streptomyces triticirhizae TaxID=2483353 RepID=A0A3M2LBN3_9ACTN|nr:recombination regulator RecX [Streptomyces triticirhizae]RMI32078.1 recombination regulator RecX [Streptomyces triticirhizae]